MPSDLQSREATSDAVRGAVQELSRGRWNRFREDLMSYLERNADRILESDPLRRARKLARVADIPVAELCRARDPRMEYALYIATFARLCADRTIRSRDEYDEQRAELHQAIWTLGERLGRPPTPDEIRDRMETWLRESAGPQREKIVLIAQLLMRNDWPHYVQPLWAALERRHGASGPDAPPSR
jgi:hypothetical protein